ncbi:MAG: LysR family transcriptional regulator [Bdellovibrionota bacterium]
MIPSSQELTYFIEIASTSNLSRAAERLGVTQPSLTLAIQRLEATVGTPLLIRSKRGVTLTQAGKQVLAHARSLLEDWDAIRSRALASANEVQGSYVIGCHPSVAIYTLPLFLPKFLAQNPRLEVRLHHDLSRRVLESVIRLQTDLGIIVNPTPHPDLIIKTLCDDDVGFWVGKGNFSTQNPGSGEGVLICDPDLLQTQELLKRAKRLGITFKRTIYSSNLEVVTELTAAGAGIGILPTRPAEALSRKRLKRVPGSPVFKDKISIVYRHESRKTRAIQALAEGISKAFA